MKIAVLTEDPESESALKMAADLTEKWPGAEVVVLHGNGIRGAGAQMVFMDDLSGYAAEKFDDIVISGSSLELGSFGQSLIVDDSFDRLMGHSPRMIPYVQPPKQPNAERQRKAAEKRARQAARQAKGMRNGS
jgi:hypothetical protein